MVPPDCGLRRKTRKSLYRYGEIAEYYSDETLIAGYDLINEPVLPSGVSLEDFRQLYIDITDAVREVDTNHIVYIEELVWRIFFD